LGVGEAEALHDAGTIVLDYDVTIERDAPRNQC